jgi:hypothetical protein
MSPAQRTAVQLRPHQQTIRAQLATTEPVVLEHGREVGGLRSRQRAAGYCNGLLGGLFQRIASVHGTRGVERVNSGKAQRQAESAIQERECPAVRGDVGSPYVQVTKGCGCNRAKTGDDD